MRIGHLTWVFSALGGGIPPVIDSLARAQARDGVRPRVFGVSDPAAPTIQTTQVDLRIGRLRGPRAFGWAPDLSRELRDFSPDVLHLHGLFTWPSFAAEAFGRRTRRPVMIAPHGMLEPWALAHSRWKKRVFLAVIERRNLESAACLHALNKDEARNFRALGLTQPIAFIPNGVDAPPEAPKRPPQEVWPELPVAQRRWILFLGRLHPKKGLPLLLEAFRRLPPAVARDWGLLIAGPDQLGHRGELEKMVRVNGLTDAVHFLGALHGDEKEQAFRLAHGFALPSYSEGTPVAVLEAMTRGLPVMITRECHLDAVSVAGGGLLGEASVESVSEMLKRFVAFSDGERQRMGARAKDFVDANYGWDRIAKMSIDVYQWLMGEADAPECVSL